MKDGSIAVCDGNVIISKMTSWCFHIFFINFPLKSAQFDVIFSNFVFHELDQVKPPREGKMTTFYSKYRKDIQKWIKMVGKLEMKFWIGMHSRIMGMGPEKHQWSNNSVVRTMNDIAEKEMSRSGYGFIDLFGSPEKNRSQTGDGVHFNRRVNLKMMRKILDDVCLC